jgi:hypothetical protein
MNFFKMSMIFAFCMSINIFGIVQNSIIKEKVCPVSGVVIAASEKDDKGSVTTIYEWPARHGYLESYISQTEPATSYAKFVKYPPMPINQNAWFRVLAKSFYSRQGTK